MDQGPKTARILPGSAVCFKSGAADLDDELAGTAGVPPAAGAETAGNASKMLAVPASCNFADGVWGRRLGSVREMKRPSPFIFIAVLVALAAALNYLFGSPLHAWEVTVLHIDQPLLGIPLMLVILAIVPIIFLVRTGNDRDA
jgi:hypothetical protein